MKYSAWMYDPTVGWGGVHRVTLDEAVRMCRDFKRDWDNVAVAVTLHGVDPEPYFALALSLDHLSLA